MKVCVNGQGHMTKIDSKKLQKIFFSRTRKPLILKLGMKHQAMVLYRIYTNHDPEMILTYFTARSTLVASAFEWGKLLK